ncbi:MAG TPA: hypothetical protein VN428_10100 [Bryobacteraceae bacterium]|nr:hypothetical protein [Bryobacteraceae bacterium]
MRSALVLCLAALSAAAADYSLDKAGAPPPEVAPAIRETLATDGSKIVGPKGVVAEIWWRKELPAGKNSESNVSLSDVTHGTLMGVVRFPEKALDRRGQVVPPGLYTMRLSFFPVDGAHQGVAPTRDFVLLTPAADDKDPNTTPDYHQLVTMSKKVTGTNHPAILNLWKADAAGPDALKQEGEDWVLYSTVGGKPVALIVVGVHAG